MPRGRKKYTLEEKFELVNTEISNTEQALKELKEQKKGLENQLKNLQLSELNALIEGNGLSIEDVKSLIENPENE